MLELSSKRSSERSSELANERISIGSHSSETKDEQSSLILYQSSDCFSLIREAMLCEGMEAPASKQCQPHQVADALAKAEESLIFIEVTDSLIDAAQTLKRLVSHNARVVLVGSEDRISTYRTLEELGFYYLLWPADKNEVISFLQDIIDDIQRSKGPHFCRSAMRIAVVSMKGGSGCTMVAAELAYGLFRKTSQPVMVADHSYCHSNMAIMLGKKDLARRPVSEEAFRHHTLTNILDPVGVQSLLVRVERGISYLGFESRSVDPAQMREYTHDMISTQLRETNFIIEDYSASVNFYPDPRWLCPLVNCVVLVVQPSLSGLHETREFLRQFCQEMAVCNDPARLMVVLNHSVPPETIDKAMVEQFLDYPVTVELPYQKHCETWLTSGKRFIEGRNRLAVPFQQLVRVVLGKPAHQKRSLVQRIKGTLQGRMGKRFAKPLSDRKMPEINEETDDVAVVSSRVISKSVKTASNGLQAKNSSKPTSVTES